MMIMDDDDDGGGGGGGGGDGGSEGGDGEELWKFAYTDICDKYTPMKSLRLKWSNSWMTQDCYKTFVWGDFIPTKNTNRTTNKAS